MSVHLPKLFSMSTNSISNEYSRFDTRLPLELKQLFEKAASIGGFRNLSDFILQTAKEKARKIIQENEIVLASKRDSTIFFDAITQVQEPNEALKSALQDYEIEVLQ